jgi:transposase InsO family protein
MGLKNSPDIFQEKMSGLMAGLEFVRTYIDDILIITNSLANDSEEYTFEKHLEQIEKVFERLQDAGLKVNAKKSFFGRHELEYLGYWVTRNGIQPIPKKVKAIVNLETPKTRKEVRKFIGMINFYRDMWRKRSELLAPLTRLTSKDVPFKWTDVEQKAFDDIKRVLSTETLLAYPQFDKPFVIHTDASDTQLGAVISQDKKPIAFYSRKLSPTQKRYTTTEQELLSIVETLKEFRNILLGHEIIVYTDHRNLTFKNFNTDRVMRWRLAIEEYCPDLVYIKGEKNVVADALSRLASKDDEIENIEFISDHFGFDDKDLPRSMYPLKFSTLAKYQRNDKKLMKKAESNEKYSSQPFHGGENDIELITKEGKIVIPEQLQERVVQWYHTFLCHPGETRTENTIRQHFTFKGLRPMVQDIVGKCSVCQKSKKHNKKYGHLPIKIAETNPWETLCVDLIGPYTVSRKGGKSLTLWCCTMIDPATGWVEILEIDRKSADEIINVVDQAWLSRYPWPTKVISDRGGEFMKEFSESLEEYGIKKKTITTRNPQANAILERAHQTIGNIIRTFDFEDLDEEDPWSGIISAAAFALRATISTTTEKSPMQMVYGRDAILNIKHTTDWTRIKKRKQELIKSNNVRENIKRIKHTYSVGDKILIRTETNKAKYDDLYLGPYVVIQVNDNGTLKYRNGAITDTVNIRQVHPFKE